MPSIETLRGTLPVGAVVTMALKRPGSGQPYRKGRFYILDTKLIPVDPKDDPAKVSSYRKLTHPLHDAYKPFNDLSNEDPRCKVLHGNLLLPTREACARIEYKASVLPGTGPAPGGGVLDTPPGGFPACIGDGQGSARRFDGLDKDGRIQTKDIVCPDQACPFRQGPKPECSIFSRFWFSLRWPDEEMKLESTLARFQTSGWDSTEAIKGLLDVVEETAKGMNLEREAWDFTGLPFEMRVEWTFKPHKGRKWPSVRFAVGDLAGFFEWKADKRRHILAAPRSVALLSDGRREDSAGAIAAASEAITPGYHLTAEALGEVVEHDGIPAETVEDAIVVEELPYRIKDDDPRDPIDRLSEFSPELTLDKLDALCLELVGVKALDVEPGAQEAAVARELAARKEETP